MTYSFSTRYMMCYAARANDTTFIFTPHVGAFYIKTGDQTPYASMEEKRVLDIFYQTHLHRSLQKISWGGASRRFRFFHMGFAW